jgi:AraC family transcriptional regulator, transcriptional activator of pobA
MPVKRGMKRVKKNTHLDEAAGHGGSIFARRVTPLGHGQDALAVTHDFAVLSLLVGGAARIEQRAIWSLEAGDVLIVPAGEPHRWVEARQADAWAAGFCVPCVAADGLTALLEPFERVRGGASPVVRVSAERRSFIESLFKELSDQVATAAASVRQSLLTLIINEVSRAAAWSAEDGPERSIAAQTLRYIERHCLEPLTLTTVAAAMRRTPAYITTALTRATGRSAVAWITAGRMAEARRRLLHSDERVDIVAERVGYADVTHFIRVFRRTHGATPAAWRTAQQRLLSH